MGFDYTLWDADGAELPAFHALYTITGITYPRGPSGMDLDFYRNHQVPDLTYHYADIDVLEVQPAGSAQVAIFGPEIPSYEDCASLEMSDEPVALGMEIIPGLSPMKEQQFLCFRTNEGRLGRIYQRMVYFDSSMAPLPYGDIISSLDFYEASTITPGGEETADYMVDYTADTWTLEGEPPFSEVPQRKDGDGFSGRVLLPYKDGFDFDTGSTMMDFRALPDVEYLGDDVSRQAALSPFTDDILLAAMGDSEPGYQDCVEADLLNKLVIMEEGQHYCVKTSAGRYATFLVNDFYFDIDVALDNSLVMFADITYKSWALDGQHYLVHAPALALDDGGDWLYPGGYDLDMIFGSGMLELEMTSETDEQMILTPVQGFSLAYWGVQRPTQADCAGDELGMKPVTVNIDPLQPTNIQGYNKMKAPTFYCYQTDEGRRGVLQVSGTYYQLESDTMYLIAAAETWFDSFETFAQVSAMRDKEMALIAGGTPETGEAPEMPSVEAAGSSVSGEARMGNVTAMDFFNGAVLYDDAVSLGDILVEFSPESLEGCFISMGSTGSILGEIPGDLDKIVLTEEEALIGGCMPVVVNTVYSVSRIQPPEGVVLFRVIAFDADGVTLEYIIK